MQNLENVELASVQTLCRIYECHPATIWRNVKRGVIPAPIKVGGLTRWRMADIRAALSGDESEAA